MKIFFLVTATSLAVVIGLTLLTLGFLVDKEVLRRCRLAIVVLDVLLIGACVLGLTGSIKVSDVAISTFGDIFTVVFMSQAICIVLVVVALIIRGIYRILNKPAPFSRQRRAMLSFGLLYPIGSLITAGYGNMIERNDTVDNFYDIHINSLPAELNGFKIAQISDVHLGAFFSLERLESLLSRIASTKPDLLAITGDIFDSVEMNPEAIKLVDSFCDKFRYGIYYCHGNHEHRRSIEVIERELAKTKIHVLINNSEALTNDSRLYLVGVDYPVGVPTVHSKSEAEQRAFDERRREYLTVAMEGVPKGAICVLLAHHPEFIDEASEFNIPLTLTGHTHGSQFGVMGVPLFPVFKYTRGMFEHLGSDGQTKCYGYVHVGNGSWFPFRLGCPPEIAYFTLKG